MLWNVTDWMGCDQVQHLLCAKYSMYADFGPNVALITTPGLHQSLLRSEGSEGNGNLVSRVISHTCASCLSRLHHYITTWISTLRDLQTNEIIFGSFYFCHHCVINISLQCYWSIVFILCHPRHWRSINLSHFNSTIIIYFYWTIKRMQSFTILHFPLYIGSHKCSSQYKHDIRECKYYSNDNNNINKSQEDQRQTYLALALAPNILFRLKYIFCWNRNQEMNVFFFSSPFSSYLLPKIPWCFHHFPTIQPRISFENCCQFMEALIFQNKVLDIINKSN